MRKHVVKKIRQVVTKVYPAAKVLVFGSCACGLNLAESDIDLLVYNPAVKDVQMINKLSMEFVRAGICSSIEPIKSAKVPIIKIADAESGINVDLSFNRENGVYCVKLVR